MYYYDLRKVAYEYEQAEEYLVAGDKENAIKHYQLAIDNYNYADNECVCSPHTKFIIEVTGKRRKHLDILSIVDASSWKIDMLRNGDSQKIGEHKSGWWKCLRQCIRNMKNHLLLYSQMRHTEESAQENPPC